MFKVGDRVRIVNPVLDNQKELKGHTFIVRRTCFRDCYDGQDRMWLERELELVEGFKMEKEDLKVNDIVTLRNGDRLVYTQNGFKDIGSSINNSLCYLTDLNNDLTYNGTSNKNDIVKVERPVKYETVFEREEVQELTVDEISEKLGYKVKVVGEDR